jgi:hypothetical protein
VLLYKHLKDLLATFAAKAVGLIGRGEGGYSMAKREATKVAA